MAEFTWVESAGTQTVDSVTVASTRFGDGYEERAPAGLNPLNQSFPVRFADVDNAVADAIVAFFKARVNAVSGLEAFDYTPLWSTTKIKVTCREWTRSHSDTWGESSIDATFIRTYEP